MQKPQITTIIPTYRRPKMLRRAIRSVLAQTYPHFRVMVLDNASGDETPEVVAELARDDPRVKYRCHAENIGALANFDYGVRHVETPFFSLLSDDDLVLPHFYETVLQGFEQHPDAVFSAGTTVRVGPPDHISSAPVAAWAPGYYTPPDGAFQMLLTQVPNWTAILFRRNVLKYVRWPDGEAAMACELDFELRIAVRFPFVVDTRPCAFLVGHPASCSNISGLGLVWPAVLKVMRHVTEDQRVDLEVRERLWAILADMLIHRLIHASIGCVRRRRFDEARKAGVILQRCFGKKATGLLLQGFAQLARRAPGAVRLLNAVNSARMFFRRRRALRHLAKTWGAGLEESRRHLRLLRYEHHNGGEPCAGRTPAGEEVDECKR